MTRAVEELSAEDWKRLDDTLDSLLQMDSSAQQRRLDEIANERPADAALLTHLLNEQENAEGLNHHLESALRFLAGHEDVPPGTRIGAWEIVEPIGRGGMAEVFVAERADGAFQRRVALKLLWPGLVNADAERLVRQERQILADLDDPRIADLVDGGVTTDGRPWLAMELVEGESITAACDRRSLPLNERINLLIDVAGAVASAHRQLAVHGDIKPSNVLVTDKGQVKLLDFGIGRLLGSDSKGWSALTPAVTSPEQASGHPPTPSSDIYQLGLLMRTLLDDTLPPYGRRADELAAIERRAISDDPKARYRGADRFADDLSAYLAHRPIDAMDGRTPYRLRCFARRRWGSLTVAIALLVFAGAAVAYQLRQTRLLAERNEANEAMLAYLEELLNRDNPQRSTADGERSLLDDAATELVDRLADQPPARARVLNALGRIHRARNEIVTAGRRYGAAMELAREHGLDDVLEESLEGLAVVGNWGGHYARSEELLRELLTVRKAKNSARALVDRTRLELADLLHSRGKYRAALEFARRAHASASDTGWSSRVIGMIQRDLGQLAEAQELFSTSLTSELAREPVVETRLAELSDHRVILALRQGDERAASEALAESKRLRVGYLGEDWDGLLWTRHWEALLETTRGDSVRAAMLLDRMLTDYRRFIGEPSHLLAFGRSDRAWSGLALGDVEGAGSLFALARARLESMQDGDHPRLAEVLLGQALVALATGTPSDARDLSLRALTIRRSLPADALGAIAWRANACRVHRWAGGSCPEDAPANLGLEASRLHYAVSGLCAENEDRSSWCGAAVGTKKSD